VETKVVITKVQRQKRKYVTVVAGLETVPNLKIKDASKVLERNFLLEHQSMKVQLESRRFVQLKLPSLPCLSSTMLALSLSQVVIQGDVLLDLPSLLISQFQVSGCSF
jgi:translation initiation factor 1 (eIF-1/SUI1)